MENPKKTKFNLKNHLVEATAILSESFPIFAAFEVGIAKMPHAVSQKAKLIGGTLGYLGLCSAFNWGRDYSRKKFKITGKSKEWKQHVHDMSYVVVFNLGFGPPLYFAAGSRDLKEIAIATGSAMLVGGLNGGFVGYSVDVFRDLTGIKECNRPSYPNFVKRQSKRVKSGIATGLVAASMGAMGLIYSLAPNNEQDIHNNPIQIEQFEDTAGNLGNLEGRLS